MKKDPVILITNDDGFDAEGIHIVIDAMKDILPAVVVAPQKNQSGVSHRVTLWHAVPVRTIGSHPAGVPVYIVDGTPADCTRLGVYRLVKGPVRLVIAGVNHGANLGDDVIYSGTVAAAR